MFDEIIHFVHIFHMKNACFLAITGNQTQFGSDAKYAKHDALGTNQPATTAITVAASAH